MTADDRDDGPVTMADLVAEARRTRKRAIRHLRAEPELALALRRVLYTDRDAEVRAAAAHRLGELDLEPLAASLAGSLESWLVEALGDHAPLVRDAILRALAKRGSRSAVTAVRAVVETDRVWWVRRTAVYTLAALAGADEVPAFKAVLFDPFWRVRHAAVKVLAVLGARDLDVRDEVIQAPATPALEFLRASWGPVAVEAPARAATGTSLLPAALLDPDPAVVTARLLESRDTSPVALVEMLCDPHAPLRILAAERIAESQDHAALVAALDWLEEPRVPHVADTVEYLLDHLGDPALAIAEHALAQPTRTGAARWAIAWAVATHSETLYDAALERARTDVSLRRFALRLASNDELLAWADGSLTDAIAIELHERHAYDALLALDTMHHPAAAALQIDAAARGDDWARALTALADPHHGPRAIATRWVVRTHRQDGTTQLRDPDPAVREAALTADHAAALVADPDPWVVRAAIEHLVVAWHGHSDVPATVAHAAQRALASTDPWVRAQACRLPITGQLEQVIAALADPDEMVRSAALDALEHAQNLDTRLRAITASPRGGVNPPHSTSGSDVARRMIHAWLHGDALPAVATPPIVTTPRAPRAPATVDHRAFGRAGFTVAPLAISGAFDLSPAGLRTAADAGVNLWFWEPAYDNLTRFLHPRAADHVITGSYHADARSIEADVDRALRKLRRDTLDVLLLFWTRSPARVDPAAYAAIAHLKRSGKVRALGFSTHHRDLARTALQTSPWDVVMIRHSAAHPGIETELLPTARELGTAVITFSALTYGRMLSGPHAPTPADCYRYSLSQPGVTACISAPRRRDEVVENVDVLRTPILAPEKLAALREHGLGVRAENQRFNALLRQPTRDAAAAARELLATELPPSDEVVQRPLPRSSPARTARTNLGKTRTRR